MNKSLFFVAVALLLGNIAQAQWTQQASNFLNPSRGIKHISVVDSNVVWATGYDGITPTHEIREFTRTIDGGTTWVSDSIPGYLGFGMSMICAVTSTDAWIPMWNPAGGGVIMNTIDGGASWQAQTTATFAGPAGFPNVVYFWDYNNGFCMGDPNGGYFEIYTTNNGGSTWTRVPQANIPANVSGEYGVTGYYSVVGSTVWFSTNKAHIFRSDDMGQNWVMLSAPAALNNMQFKIVFRDMTNGIIRLNESPYNTYETSDGGATWTPMTPIGNFYEADYCYVPGTENAYVSVGSDYTTPKMGISYSLDGGHNWTDFVGSDTTQHLFVAFASNRIGYVGNFNNYGTDGFFRYLGTDFPTDLCADLIPAIIMDTDTADLFVSGLVNFTDASLGAPTNWAWDFGDGSPLVLTQNASHTYATTGTFLVSLIIGRAPSCVDTLKRPIVVINSMGVEDMDQSAKYQLYPNPAGAEFFVMAQSNQSDYVIMDSRGRIVQAGAFTLGLNRIESNEWSNGIYIIRIINENGTAVLRMQKQ